MLLRQEGKGKRKPLLKLETNLKGGVSGGGGGGEGRPRVAVAVAAAGSTGNRFLKEISRKLKDN